MYLVLLLSYSGRINFDKVLFNAGKATVYFVGNPSVAERIHAVCKKYKLQFIRDYTNTLLPKSDRLEIKKYLRIVFKVSLYVLMFLMLLSVYTKT